MPKQALKAHLDQLRTELDEPDSLDAETRKLLADVAERIDAILGEDLEDQSLRERIDAVTLGYEARHPRFARLLSDLSDTLAKLGI